MPNHSFNYNEQYFEEILSQFLAISCQLLVIIPIIFFATALAGTLHWSMLYGVLLSAILFYYGEYALSLYANLVILAPIVISHIFTAFAIQPSAYIFCATTDIIVILVSLTKCTIIWSDHLDIRRVPWIDHHFYVKILTYVSYPLTLICLWSYYELLIGITLLTPLINIHLYTYLASSTVVLDVISASLSAVLLLNRPNSACAMGYTIQICAGASILLCSYATLPATLFTLQIILFFSRAAYSVYFEPVNKELHCVDYLPTGQSREELSLIHI